MQIGILTFHRALNYGAFLQCFALKRTLEHQGHQASIIDYWPLYHARRYRYFKHEHFQKYGIKYLIHFLLQLPMKLIRSRRMARIQRQYFGTTDKVLYPCPEDLCTVNLDAMVYGSDQIWWRGEDIPTKYDFAYWGDYVRVPKRITYAASMGIIRDHAVERDILSQKLQQLDAISVREQQLLQYLSPLTDKPIHIVADPTLLIPADEWRQLAKPHRHQEPYLLLFNLTDLPFTREVAQVISSQRNLPVVEVTAAVRDERIGRNYIQTADALEWVGLIRDAEFVVTSSFHGVCFSILMEKQFIACGFGDNTDRLFSLLAQLGISNRHTTDISQLPLDNIDYGDVTSTLCKLRNESLSFLTQALK